MGFFFKKKFLIGLFSSVIFFRFWRRKSLTKEKKCERIDSEVEENLFKGEKND